MGAGENQPIYIVENQHFNKFNSFLIFAGRSKGLLSGTVNMCALNTHKL